MRKVKWEPLLYALVAVSIVSWAVLLLVNKIQINVNAEAAWAALQHIPTVVTIDLLLVAIFVKWAWKVWPFQSHFVPFPCIQGTWRGTIQTSPGGDVHSVSIPAILVIRQSFIHISCVMYTKEMSSRSFAAEFLIDEETESVRLTYTYTSVPFIQVRSANPIHDGAVLLNVFSTPSLALEGEYWTARLTGGSLNFERIDEKPLNGKEAATKLDELNATSGEAQY